MMGPQKALLYEFSFERHVAGENLVRAIESFADFSGVRAHHKPYGAAGCSSISTERMIRALMIGYCFGAEGALEFPRRGHECD